MKPFFLSMILSFIFCTSTGCSVRPLAKGMPMAPHQTASTTPSIAEAPSSFDVIAKASLSDAKRHTHISLRWKQVGEYYVIHLYGPLGHGAVRLSNHESTPTNKQPYHKIRRSKSPKALVHYQDMRGEIRSYGSAEALLEKECGWKLPVSGLSWWLRGLARPEAPAIVVPNNKGLTTQIEQDGWTIEYLAYTSIKGIMYPHKVRLSRNKLLLKFVLRNWHIDTKPPG